MKESCNQVVLHTIYKNVLEVLKLLMIQSNEVTWVTLAGSSLTASLQQNTFKRLCIVTKSIISLGGRGEGNAIKKQKNLKNTNQVKGNML